MRKIITKKADLPSIILAVLTIFIIGIIVFFSNHVNNALYDGLDNYFEGDSDYNNSEVHVALQDIQGAENSTYDYITLVIAMGFILVLALTAFSTRISPVFFWIYAFLSIFVLSLGVIASNMWQEVVANPEFAVTITRFPITNAILGSYYPTIVTAIILITMVLLFGKRASPNE